MKQQSGFTLIELIMVIVILGILAATALPKFVDLGSDAKAAATNGVAGALGSASAINYAAYQANTSKGVTLNSCTGVGALLQGGLPSGYTITASTVATGGGTAVCTVTGQSSTTANFTAIGV